MKVEKCIRKDRCTSGLKVEVGFGRLRQMKKDLEMFESGVFEKDPTVRARHAAARAPSADDCARP